MQGILPALLQQYAGAGHLAPHAWEALRAHFVVNTCESIGSMARGSRRMQELEHELDLRHKENDNLRCQVRCYHNEVDDMHQQEYEERHDHYEWHGSYN